MIDYTEIENHWVMLGELKRRLGFPGCQLEAPCLGGIAHNQTRYIVGDGFEAGPEWIVDGKVESCKDTYELQEIPISDDGETIKIYRCTRRAIPSNKDYEAKEEYLSQSSVEHLLKLFAQEYLSK